jgi:peptidoglycan hydrolase-like protein with peptidoglycan-binding domain
LLQLPLTIGGAVGAASATGVPATNARDDVFVVQGLLNNIDAAGGGASPKLVFDGLIGPLTVAAIRRFQQTQLGFQDGRVDPGQITIARLNVLAAVRCVRIHLKVLTNPTIPSATMITTMRRVFAQAAIGVELVSTQNLTLPLLNDLNVGSCPRGTTGPTTPDQDALFTNQDGIGPNEMAVYLVRSTIPPLNGCSTHPPGPFIRPGVTVVQAASAFTLAHEVAHVLGLDHLTTEAGCTTPDFNRLMTGCGTANITRLAPLLDATEIATLRSAAFLFAC